LALNLINLRATTTPYNKIMFYQKVNKLLTIW
jgi:hypothetical protein